LLDVSNQRIGFVLRENADLTDIGIDAVGQWKIDNTKLAAKWNRRLGPPVGHLLESGTATTGQNQGDCVTG
jgi:hypothetical protein